jgi:hypothetical protein
LDLDQAEQLCVITWVVLQSTQQYSFAEMSEQAFVRAVQQLKSEKSARDYIKEGYI